MPGLENMIVHFDSPFTMVSAPQGGSCGDCGSIHFLFINRDGRTRCAGCDWNYQHKRKAELRQHVIGGGEVSPISEMSQIRRRAAAGHVELGVELGLFEAAEPEDASAIFLKFPV